MMHLPPMNHTRRPLHARKGQITEFIIFGVLLFVTVVFVGIMHQTQKGINDAVQASDQPQVSKDFSQKATGQFSPVWDKGLFFLFLMVHIIIPISSLFLDSHPVIFAVSLLLYFFIAGFIMLTVNNYEAFTAGISTTWATDFPLTDFGFTHALTFYLVSGMTTLIFTYGKIRNLV